MYTQRQNINYLLLSAIDSGGAGGARALLEFWGSEKGQSLISAYWKLAITTNTPWFKKLSAVLITCLIGWVICRAWQHKVFAIYYLYPISSWSESTLAFNGSSVQAAYLETIQKTLFRGGWPVFCIYSDVSQNVWAFGSLQPCHFCLDMSTFQQTVTVHRGSICVQSVLLSLAEHWKYISFYKLCS